MTKQISNIIEQNWKQLKANIKENWNKLNDEDITDIEGQYINLISKLEEVYDITKTQAELQVKSFVDELDKSEGIASATIDALAKPLKKCQQKFDEVNTTVSSYVKNKPAISIGIAAIAGYTIAKLVDFKNSFK